MISPMLIQEPKSGYAQFREYYERIIAEEDKVDRVYNSMMALVTDNDELVAGLSEDEKSVATRACERHKIRYAKSCATFSRNIDALCGEIGKKGEFSQ